jgi:hypothetical protein
VYLPSLAIEQAQSFLVNHSEEGGGGGINKTRFCTRTFQLNSCMYVRV